MQLRISKESEVPVHQQLVEQFAYLITTEKLKPGEALPSVRELARRLKIHHNTVSDAYQELVRRRWLVRRPGSRLKVRPPAGAAAGSAPDVRDIDDIINASIRLARERGFSLQSLRERVRERLLAAPPDHILVVEQAPGLRQLLKEEIRKAAAWPVQSCSLDELAANRSLLIGALLVAIQYAISEVGALAPKDRPAIPIAFRGADESLQRIQALQKPSVIAIVSISGTFLRTGRALLAAAVGKHHTVVEFHLPLESPRVLDGADLVYCDTIALRSVKHRNKIHYQAIAPESLDYIATTMNSYQRG
jgi:DNA-binding transcriptional regulator YhcF (GntR family)